MKNVIRGIVMLSALSGTVSLMAQTLQPAPAPAPAQSAAPAAAATPTLTVEEVIAKYIEAIGGKAAIGQVKSLSMETSAEVMGNEAPGTTVILNGVGYKNETVFNDSKIIQVYTAKGGWQVNPMAGIMDPSPLPEDQYKAGKDQIYVGGALFDYAAKGNKVELLGKDSDSYKIKLTNKDNLVTTYGIDAQTFLLKSAARQGKMQDQNVDITTIYSDYKKADEGYLFPSNISVDFGGQFQVTISVTKVEVNKEIDPAIFEMPKPEAAPAAPKS